jgi:hypothetical protein
MLIIINGELDAQLLFAGCISASDPAASDSHATPPAAACYVFATAYGFLSPTAAASTNIFQHPLKKALSVKDIFNRYPVPSSLKKKQTPDTAERARRLGQKLHIPHAPPPPPPYPSSPLPPPS